MQCKLEEIFNYGDQYDFEKLWKDDLSDAIASGDISKLEEAFQKGWDVNLPLIRFYDKKRPAIMVGYHDIVFPMMWAAKNNCFESVEWLHKHGAVFDVKDYPLGETGLGIPERHAVFPALECSKEMLRFVVKRGAKTRSKDIDGWLFQDILHRKKMDWLPLLLELGADMEAAMGAVRLAVRENDLVVLKQFFEAGFDINWHNGKGENFFKNTALCEAAMFANEDTVRFLLEHGADPTIRNAKGMSPYDLALQCHELANAAILRDLCDPDGVGRKEAQEKLPEDIKEYFKAGERRLTLERDDIGYIDFLSLEDVTLLNLARRKCVLLTKEVDNYSTIWLVWNTTRKTVAYFDYEHEWYGEFGVSFTGFLAEIHKYLTGMFMGQYEL